MVLSELYRSITDLNSSKVSVRRKSYKSLIDCLENDYITKLISHSSNKKCTWTNILVEVNDYLILESRRTAEDEMKNKSIDTAIINQKNLIMTVVRKANQNGKKLSGKILIDCILNCFNSQEMFKYFGDSYVFMLKDYFFNCPQYMSDIPSVYWIDLFRRLVNLYKNEKSDGKVLQCLQLTLQNGYLYGLHTYEIRKQSSFITELAREKLRDTLGKNGLEVILNLLLDFCNQTAKDDRICCCRLGEEIMESLLNLLSKGSYDDIKVEIYKFLLFQIKIHHPKGLSRNDQTSYAFDWQKWIKDLRYLYAIIFKEIQKSLTPKFKFSYRDTNSTIASLDEYLSALGVEVFKQICNRDNCSMDEMSVSLSSVYSPMAKKMKIEFSIDSIISNIQETKDWPWIDFIRNLLKRYPNLIGASQFITLVETLSVLQNQCKHNNVRYHLYKCLCLLVDIQEEIIDLNSNYNRKQLNSLWVIVWDVAHRTAGLNENIEYTHKLIQKLLDSDNDLPFANLFSTYNFGILLLNEHSLQTLDVLCSRINLPDDLSANNKFQNYLIRWIINVDNIDILTTKIVAKILASLVLKEWPKLENRVSTNETEGNDDCLEKIYSLTSLQEDPWSRINSDENHCESIKMKYIKNEILLHVLISQLKEFSSQLLENELEDKQKYLQQIINFVILLTNLISELVKYEVISVENLRENDLTFKLNEMFHLFLVTFKNYGKRILKKSSTENINVIKTVENLFQLEAEEAALNIMFSFVPKDIIRTFFEIINSEEPKDKDDDSGNWAEVVGACQQALLALFSNPIVSNLNDVQQESLQSFLSYQYDLKLKVDYDLAMKFLKYLTQCKVSVFSNKILEEIFMLFGKICKIHYKSYDSAISLLNIWLELFPHVKHSNSNRLTLGVIQIIQPFFLNCSNFGPAFSILMIQCMGEVIKWNLSFSWMDDDALIAHHIINFLNNDCQEVRIAAIKKLTIIFSNHKINTKTTQVYQYQMFFNIIKTKVESIFEVDETLFDNPDHKIYEQVSRIAAAFLSLCTVITSSVTHKKSALYYLLKLGHDRKIDVVLVKRALNLVTDYFGFKSICTFLKPHVSYLISCWCKDGLQLNEFPFVFLGCNNNKEFYEKVVRKMSYVFFRNQQSTILKDISNTIGMSSIQLLQECLPNNIADSLCAFESNDVKYIEVFENINKYFEFEKIKSVILEKLDEVVVNIIQNTYDEKFLRDEFKLTSFLPEPNHFTFSIVVIKGALKRLEIKFLDSCSFVLICANNFPIKLQNMLLKITEFIHLEPLPEDKLIAFLKYTTLTNIIFDRLHEVKNLQTYLINDILTTLLHLICKEDDNDILKIFVCKYFSSIIPQMIKNCEVFGEQLPLLVSTLIEIIKKNINEDVVNESLKLLSTILIDNADNLENSIKNLDPLPEDEIFETLRSALHKFHSVNNNRSLKEHIEFFVRNNSRNSNRLEGLVYLRKQISINKTELERFYAEMQTVVFSENLKNNILYQLICTLLQLSKSSNNSINIEAARCLGELGPINIPTLTLNVQEKYKNIFEPYNVYMNGCILSLLSSYLFDKETSVVRETCEALYEILKYKCAEIALNSNKDFLNGKLNQLYLAPFLSQKKNMIGSKLTIDIPSFQNNVNNPALWYPVSCTFKEWIVNLVCAILNSFESSYMQSLKSVCKVKVEFAQQLLPLLLGFIINSEIVECIIVVELHLKQFFENHWRVCLDNDKETNNIVLDQEAIRCLLEAIHLAKLQKFIYNKKVSNKELSLNYLHVAKSAQFCSLYFSALQYVELWSHNKLSKIRQIHKNFDFSNDTPLYLIVKYEEVEIQQVLQKILIDIFDKIDDENALRVCTTNIFFFDPKQEIEILKQMQRWDQVALQCDIRMSHNELNSTFDLTEALKKSSFVKLPVLCQNNFENREYECAWRLNDFTLSESDKKKERSVCNFAKQQYFALKAYHENDYNVLDCAIKKAIRVITDQLKCDNFVCCKSVYGILTNLRLLEELQDFTNGKINNKLEDVISKWNRSNETDLMNLKYFETIQFQRIVLLKDEVSKGNYHLKQFLTDFLLKLAEFARIEGFDNLSNRTLSDLTYVDNLKEEMKYKIGLEEAQLWWRKDKATAKLKLTHLLNTVGTQHPKLHSDILKLYGTWMMENNSESSDTIFEYFKKSIDVLQKTESNPDNIFKMCDILGRYCDSKYQQIVDYMKSSEFEYKIKSMKNFKETVKHLEKKTSKDLTIEELKTKALYERQSKIDENEIESTSKERDNYLKMAVKYYLHNLQNSSSDDLRIFRLFSLWLENQNSNDVIELLTSGLPKIPSYKFIPILPQICPHLNPNEDNNFNNLVFQIIENCAMDHPHHTLPLVLALANANLDKKYQFEKKRNISTLRIKGAQKLLEKLKRTPLKSLIEKMEILSSALIELAHLDVDGCKKSRTGPDEFLIGKKCQFNKIKNFENVLLPTHTLPVSKSKDYSNIVGIASFDDVFASVGGINAPKRIKCLGTDGANRYQLVKGRDDLRQDAVMQQVFNIMNRFLTSNKQTSKQNLRIKTYKVVPLSQRSGILEWVENCIPLGDYLIGKKHQLGAHQRYNKNDYNPEKCRNDIANVSKGSNEERLKRFLKICHNFQPILHKFFEEYFLEPSSLYEKRRAYTRSVATNSMCGYILGIGDRHVQNILISKNTGEIVHIDFGIAFEQGRILPTPETVPFRLTRDIVAPMGIVGVEGEFRRTCENTMEILRNNSETIITILEVLLYDPLYAWSITPSQAYSRQYSKELDSASSPLINDSYSEADNGMSLNTMAERTLLRLRDKLKGNEEGIPTSIEGQVDKLIQKAKDPANLSRLYYGWKAYL